MSDVDSVKKRKLGLVAGLLVMGLVAASIAGAQALTSAAAQEEEPMPVDIGCPTGAEVCGNEIQHVGQATVSTSGTATTKVQPDKASVTVGVVTNGTTADEAASRNAQMVEQVIQALRGLGIAQDQISTSSYYVHPVYSQSEPVNACRVMEGYPVPPECYVKGEVVSYSASNSVTVELDVEGDVDAGEVIDTATQAGANEVSGVYFFISSEKQEQVRDSLIGDAIASARHRADVSAQAVDMTVSGIKSLNLNDVYFPVFRGLDSAVAEEGGSAGTPIMPGEHEVSMTVNAVFSWAIRRKVSRVVVMESSSNGKIGQRRRTDRPLPLFFLALKYRKGL